MSEWQSIETAPKDGTEFLVHSPDGFFIAVWQDCVGPFVDTVIGRQFGCTPQEWLPFTHWMPLPDAPK